jgi:hypothetical protein
VDDVIGGRQVQADAARLQTKAHVGLFLLRRHNQGPA